MNFADYFQRDPGICGGETVLRGTRVTVRTVLASLAEGSSFQEILQDYPSLSEEHVLRGRCFCRYFRERGSTSPELAPLLSESKTGREYPCLAGRGACLIGSRRSDSYWARFDRQSRRRDLEAVPA